nr:M23 family metallopeptidase [Sandaracinobacteroides sayramensis]
MFRDHELIVRTDGHVRFLRLSANVQRKAAFVAVCSLSAWLASTAALVGWQAWTSYQNRDMQARTLAVEKAEARVAAERRSVEQIADNLDDRQDQLETLFKLHFGDEPNPDAQKAGQAGTGQAEAAPQAPAADAQTMETAAVEAAPQMSQVARLQQSSLRQEQLVRALTEAAGQRASRAEAALLAIGLKANGRPQGRLAQGGPFLPWRSKAKAPPVEAEDPAMRQLIVALERMEQMESLLVAVPSGRPADGMELTSSFGYRYDPFNGQRAMHAGIDFRGPHGSPIRAAAAGRVSFVGVKNGYGNVVEIDHGHGIETRYAHLSGFNARVGQTVHMGDMVARMGSTGRSTGTHLHFEVRVDGAAVNPRRFLEANRDVLEVKADARSRVLGRVAAG